MIKKLSVLAACLVIVVLIGCAADKTAARNTTPEESTAASITQRTTQPESTSLKATTTVEKPGWVSALGDSVMLGAVDALQQEMPNLGLLNAQGSRQPQAAIDLLKRWESAGYLGDAVVIDIGNNGPFSSVQFDEMMQVLAGVPKVLIVNLTVPPGVDNPIAVPNNTVLADGVGRYSNTVLVDWHAASANHPEYFSGDSTHLSVQGAQAYAALIASQLGHQERSAAPSPGPQERISWGEGGFSGKCIGPASWCAASATP